MTRYVPRGCTHKRATRTSPWSKRAIRPTGAPRVCLTNLRAPFVVPVGEETFGVLGEFDHLLRLYQHRGVTRQSVLHEGQIRYRIEEEWSHLIELDCEWLEFVDDREESVHRIDFRSALRYGLEEPSPYGPVWAVPLGQYTTFLQGA